MFIMPFYTIVSASLSLLMESVLTEIHKSSLFWLPVFFFFFSGFAFVTEVSPLQQQHRHLRDVKRTTSGRVRSTTRHTVFVASQIIFERQI
uniref:Uncharacterized protein n=1 Tax=Cyprinus carpio TaxID=7962 RepID=A0A8C2GNX8_CYPCA